MAEEDPQGGSSSSSSSTSVHQRQQVLKAVREQAHLRSQGGAGGTTPPAEEQPRDAWKPDQWFAAFQFLFYVDDHASACHDDLIFFVKQPAEPGAACSQFTVHRKGRAVPADLSISGQAFSTVAWPETVLLNLVLQARYQLTVTACRQELLTHVAHGLDVSSQVVEVARPVYASPTQMAVNLATAKVEAEPAPTYPEIFFAVDNYDDVFNDVVLQQGDDCLCVVLKAVLPPPPAAAEPALQAGPAEPAGGSAASAASTATAGGTGPGQHSSSKQPALARQLMLFSGYVVHRQIQEHLGSKLAPSLGRLLPSVLTGMLGRMFGSGGSRDPASGAGPQPNGRRHPVHMRGPGGVGCAEVAVTAVPPPPPSGPLQGDPHSAAQAASSIPLHTALLSVSMPVHVLADALLAQLAPS